MASVLLRCLGSRARRDCKWNFEIFTERSANGPVAETLLPRKMEVFLRLNAANPESSDIAIAVTRAEIVLTTHQRMALRA